jgi:hypothetical protein
LLLSSKNGSHNYSEYSEVSMLVSIFTDDSRSSGFSLNSDSDNFDMPETVTVYCFNMLDEELQEASLPVPEIRSNNGQSVLGHQSDMDDFLLCLHLNLQKNRNFKLFHNWSY